MCHYFQVFYGSLNSGVGCGYTDISPNFSFSMNTIGNTMSSAGGMATPLIVSAFTTAYPGKWGSCRVGLRPRYLSLSLNVYLS